MADPLGHFLGRALSAFVGFKLGEKVERDHELAARLNDERCQAVANRVYNKLLAYLLKARVGTKTQHFLLKDILGETELAHFSLQVSEWVRRELRQQP